MSLGTRLGVLLMTLTVVVAAGTAAGLTSSNVVSVSNGASQGIAPQAEQTTLNGSDDGNDSETIDRSAQEIIRETSNSYEDITDFTATQVTNATYGNGTTNTVAQFYYEKPNSLRINYTAPASQAGTVIVTNGSSTVIYNATNNTVQTIDAPNISGQPTGYLATTERTLQTSNVTYEGTETVAEQETYVLSVTPAGNFSGGDIDQTYYLDQETCVPVKQHVETTFTYNNETVTSESTTVFRDLEVNTGVSDEKFDFEPPEGATVLESPINYTEYDSVDEAQANVSFEIREPAEVPEEYDLNSTTVARFGNTTSAYLTYANGSGGTMLVTVTDAQYNGSMAEGNDSDTESESESGFGEDVSIDGREGTYASFGPQASVSFPCDDLWFSISGPFEKGELITIAESVPCESSQENSNEEAESEDGIFSEPIELELDGIEISVGPPEDPDGDGISEDVTGDGSVGSADALAYAAIVTTVEDGDLDLTDEQTDALDIDGDGNLDYDDAEALLPDDETST